MNLTIPQKHGYIMSWYIFSAYFNLQFPVTNALLCVFVCHYNYFKSLIVYFSWK